MKKFLFLISILVSLDTFAAKLVSPQYDTNVLDILPQGMNLQSIINPDAFPGSYPNNTNLDSSASLQAAVNRAYLTKRAVVIPAARYRYDIPITNLHIVPILGSGKGTELFIGSGTGPMFIIGDSVSSNKFYTMFTMANMSFTNCVATATNLIWLADGVTKSEFHDIHFNEPLNAVNGTFIYAHGNNWYSEVYNSVFDMGGTVAPFANGHFYVQNPYHLVNGSQLFFHNVDREGHGINNDYLFILHGNNHRIYNNLLGAGTKFIYFAGGNPASLFNHSTMIGPNNDFEYLGQANDGMLEWDGTLLGLDYHNNYAIMQHGITVIPGLSPAGVLLKPKSSDPTNTISGGSFKDNKFTLFTLQPYLITLNTNAQDTVEAHNVILDSTSRLYSEAPFVDNFKSIKKSVATYYFDSVPPTNGTWVVGDVARNSKPVALSTNAFYTSDYSVNADGTTVGVGLSAVNGNVDGILTTNDVLQLVSNNTTGSHYGTKASVFSTGTHQYLITLNYYIPNGQTAKRLGVGIATPYAGKSCVVLTNTGSWQSATLLLTYAPSASLFFSMQTDSGADSTQFTGVNGESIYIKNFIASEITASTSVGGIKEWTCVQGGDGTNSIWKQEKLGGFYDYFGTAAPTTGTYGVNDIVWNTSPAYPNTNLTYTSDFTTTADRFVVNTGLVAVTNVTTGVSDGSTSKTNVLKIQSSTASGAHYATSTTTPSHMFTAGTNQYTITLSYYIPSTNTTIKHIAMGTSILTPAGNSAVRLDTVGTWTTTTFNFYVVLGNGDFFIGGLDASGSSSFTPANQDVFYIKDITINFVTTQTSIAGTLGWMCVYPGIPGTWLPFGKLGNDQLTFVTSTYTVLTNDTRIVVDSSAGSLTLNFPTAAGIKGKNYNIIKVSSDANTVTLDAFGAETINGAATQVISDQYGTYSLFSNGTNLYNTVVVTSGGGSGNLSGTLTSGSVSYATAAHTLSDSPISISALTNVLATGEGFFDSIQTTNGIYPLSTSTNKLLRTDSSNKIAPVTIGTGITFDGTTISATGASANTILGTLTTGVIPYASGAHAISDGPITVDTVTNTLFNGNINSYNLNLTNNLALISDTGTITLGAASDINLIRDAANRLAMKNGANNQGFRVYNTYTDASNYERGFISWSANNMRIGNEALGTGVARQLQFEIGGSLKWYIDATTFAFSPGTTATETFGDTTHRVKQIWLGGSTETASLPVIDLSQTWNSGGVTFTLAKLNATSTSSAAGSLLLDLQTGGVSQFNVSKSGVITAVGQAFLDSLQTTNGIYPLAVTASKLVRTDSSGKLAAVTIGSGITFDGTTISASGGGGGTAGTVINTGTPVIGNVPYYSDTTGTNVAPSGALIIGASTNLAVKGGITSDNIVVTNGLNAANIAIGVSVDTSKRLLIEKDNLADVPTDGIILTNNTAAVTGGATSNQQYSPSLVMSGKGWKTTATAGSQDVSFRAYVAPAQGSANPTGTWTLQSSVNGAAYSNTLLVGNGGNITSGGSITANGNITAPAANFFTISARSKFGSTADGASYVLNNAASAISTFQGAILNVAKTANYTIVVLDVGTYFNNSGAAGEVDFTLPAAVVGYHYYFYVDAAQVLKVIAVGSDTIRNAGTVSAGAGNISSSTIGSTLHMFCPVTGKWIINQITGTWSGPT